MLSWDTKIIVQGTIEAERTESCKVCNESVKSVMRVEQGILYIFWMPFFPTSRIVYRLCPACNSRLKLKPTDPDMDWVNRKFPAKFRFSYYWGLFVFSALLSVFLYYFNTLFPNFWG